MPVKNESGALRPKYGEAHVSGGASDDLHKATLLAEHMVTRLGLGGANRLRWSETPSAGDTLLVDELLNHAYQSILGKLREHSPRLASLAGALATRQELTGAETRRLALE
jgi:ATP-dependent metalloprotease